MSERIRGIEIFFELEAGVDTTHDDNDATLECTEPRPETIPRIKSVNVAVLLQLAPDSSNRVCSLSCPNSDSHVTSELFKAVFSACSPRLGWKFSRIYSAINLDQSRLGYN